MKRFKRVLCTALALLAALALMAVSAPKAWAATYQDGTYSASISLGGSGMNHNELLSPATVTVRDGNIYVDLVFHRISGQGGSSRGVPQYTSVATECGTFTSRTLDEAAQTCTFSGVQVPHLGSVDITTVTEAMSQPHEVDYTIDIDDSGIPTVSGESQAAVSGGDAAQGGAGTAVTPGLTAAVAAVIAVVVAAVLLIRKPWKKG